MISLALVLRVLLVEAVLTAGILAAVFGHALWDRRVSAAGARLLELGRAPLVTALTTGDAAGDLGVLHDMPPRVLLRLLADIAPSLVGPQRKTITRIAERFGLTQSATRSLHSIFWWRRLQGARLLTLVDGDAGGLAMLATDRHPLLRAQCAEWLGHRGDARSVDALVAMLADGDETVRFAARESLMRLGGVAQAALVHHLALEHPARLTDLLDVAAAIPSPVFLEAALLHSTSASVPVRVRAARLLRAVGAGAAVERLVALLADDAASIRAVAASALGTLGHWPAAAAVARLLHDADWEVRIAASVALQRLGAPGELLLRRARDGAPGVGAEVARQVLDVAGQLAIPTGVA